MLPKEGDSELAQDLLCVELSGVSAPGVDGVSFSSSIRSGRPDDGFHLCFVPCPCPPLVPAALADAALAEALPAPAAPPPLGESAICC